jgi:HAD superfamily hydrolase (TIGR01549 family)
MKYSHTVFDVDGTLVDTDEAILSSLQITVQQLTGTTIRQEDLYFALGIPGEAALRQLGIQNIMTADQIWEEHYARSAASCKLYPHINEAILRLSGHGLRLGIVTSRSREEYVRDSLLDPLRPYFDLVICKEDSKKHKPDPEPMLTYISRTGANPTEILYVGDTRYDMQCARRACADSALALWNGRTGIQSESTYRISSVFELLDIILAIRED